MIYTLGKFREVFELGSIYKLSKPADNAGVWINGIETYSDFEGSYYPDFEAL